MRQQFTNHPVLRADPVSRKFLPIPERPIEERFWEKVDKSGDCWLWIGYTNPGGYGTFHTPATPVLAHRFAWVLVNGPIPGGSALLHHCDVRACVRPTHLFLGTLADNNADMHAKGRQAVGEMLPQSKLTSEQVLEIRALFAAGARQSDLARTFRMGQSAISQIVRGLSWRHL